jgi:hypothetical protein
VHASVMPAGARVLCGWLRCGAASTQKEPGVHEAPLVGQLIDGALGGDQSLRVWVPLKRLVRKVYFGLDSLIGRPDYTADWHVVGAMLRPNDRPRPAPAAPVLGAAARSVSGELVVVEAHIPTADAAHSTLHGLSPLFRYRLASAGEPPFRPTLVV